MNALKSKRYVWASLALLLMITLVLGWFIGHNIPGAPRDPQPDVRVVAEASIPRGTLTNIAIEDVEEIPFGDTKRIEGLTHGDKYMTQEVSVVSMYDWQTKEVTVWTEAVDIELDPESERYSVEFPPFEVTVTDAKAVTYESFVDWYPEFGAYPTAGSMRPGSKMVLVEATVANLSETQTLDLGEAQLWSDDLVQMFPEHMGNGYQISYGALRCMNGISLFVEAGEPYRDPSSLASIEPGETRSVILPYQVFEEAFFDAGDFEELDLSRFDIEVNDYDTATVYRFLLG